MRTVGSPPSRWTMRVDGPLISTGFVDVTSTLGRPQRMGARPLSTGWRRHPPGGASFLPSEWSTPWRNSWRSPSASGRGCPPLRAMARRLGSMRGPILSVAKKGHTTPPSPRRRCPSRISSHSSTGCDCQDRAGSLARSSSRLASEAASPARWHGGDARRGQWRVCGRRPTKRTCLRKSGVDHNAPGRACGAREDSAYVENRDGHHVDRALGDHKRTKPADGLSSATPAERGRATAVTSRRRSDVGGRVTSSARPPGGLMIAIEDAVRNLVR